MKAVRILAAVLIVCLATVLPAEAQIYSWRDASGTLVLSNKPRAESGEVTTYAVRGAARVQTTRPPADDDDTEQTRYDALIDQYAAIAGVPADLVRAIIQAESGFNPRAVSRKGAMGLMQLMPATARELGVRDPFHPAENIRGGITYLAQLLARYDQNVELALAAYNAGPGAVERYGHTVPPYRETREYVRKITANPAAAAATVDRKIYKWVETVDGIAKVRYSNVPPTGVPYEIVGSR